ncbi:MAG: T9SS type A sorting domain-containing protein [Bacteroidota bacterium]
MKRLTQTFIPVFVLVFSLFIVTANAQVVEGHGRADDGWSEYEEDNLDVLPQSLRNAEKPVLTATNPNVDGLLKVWYNQVQQVSDLMLTDINGRLYHREKIGTDKRVFGQRVLDVSGLSQGIYIVQLRSGKTTSYRKVYIQ